MLVAALGGTSVILGASALRRWLLGLAAGAAGACVGGALVFFVLRPCLGERPLLLPHAAVVSPAAAVYRRVAPSVVLVTSRSTAATPSGTQPQLGWGSGVIFDPRGYIVTNEHVVAGAKDLTVTLADGQTLPASLVGGDPATDLAVVRVRAGRPLVAAAFAADASIVPGELAVAIGNPLGPQFALTVTQGVVSAIRPMLYGLRPQDERVTAMIQTDVAINPGNSGGPLCDAQGLVMGINSIQVPQVSPGIAAAGLGFAIPAGTVRQVVDDLVRHGYVRRAWLGAFLKATPPRVLPAERQAVDVDRLVPGGPAETAGLRAGDRILAWNGVPVRNYYDLVLRINAALPGQRVALTVSAGGVIRVVTVVLGLAPPPAAAS